MRNGACNKYEAFYGTDSMRLKLPLAQIILKKAEIRAAKIALYRSTLIVTNSL